MTWGMRTFTFVHVVLSPIAIAVKRLPNQPAFRA